MAGYPNGEFDVTNLTVSPEIVRQGQTSPELFTVSAEYDGDVSSLIWDLLEFISTDLVPPVPVNADIRWFLESIGPGSELVIAETTEQLTVTPGGPYTVTFPDIDPDGTFTQPDGTTLTLDKGVYRLQCRVDVLFGPVFYTGFYSGDVLFRVA